MSDKKEKKEKVDMSFMEVIEASPDFQDMEEDHAVEFLRKNNPELYEIMKQAGLKEKDVD
jgi:hypothetical protein